MKLKNKYQKEFIKQFNTFWRNVKLFRDETFEAIDGLVGFNVEGMDFAYEGLDLNMHGTPCGGEGRDEEESTGGLENSPRKPPPFMQVTSAPMKKTL